MAHFEPFLLLHGANLKEPNLQPRRPLRLQYNGWAVPQIFSTSRAEAAVIRFPPLFFPLLIALALAAQAYLPVLAHVAVYLDLPLLVVVYWAITSRNQISSSTLGMILGLLQDSLAHLALGVNGVAKTLIGYTNASFGARMDADHPGIRLVIVAAAFELNRIVLYSFQRFLLGAPIPWRGLVYLLAALMNGLLAIVLFRLFDGFRRWI